MDRLKKLNGSMIAAIVLSVLLIMSVTAGATLAWFASRDNATNTLVMGEAVVVTIGEDYKQGDGSLAMTLPVDPTTGGLLPGMAITPNVRVHLQESNTNALVRARFITTVEYPDGYMDAAYEDTEKYPSIATSGKVLADEVIYLSPSHPDFVTEAEAEVLNQGKQESEKKSGGEAGTYNIARTNVYNVYAGTITYNYYNYLGNLEAKSKTVNLARVEVRQSIVDQIGKGKDGENGVIINGVKVAATETNAAELEIRQRGVDLTNAINRVLAGQRGFGINPTNGQIVDDADVGVKYTRRVADGWAYRDADQCWYYMGSKTNGFTFTASANESYDPDLDKYVNTNGDDDLIDISKPAAKDITAYTRTPVGNVYVQRPTYTALTTTANAQGKDQERNYLGGTKDDVTLDRYNNEVAVLNNTNIASVDLSQGNVQIDFLTKRFVLPTFINNNYAKAQISFSFTVEAIQDYLIDPLQEATSAADRVPNNLVNAIMVFNNAFPQKLVAGGTEAALANMGTVANIIPGGGTSVEWDQESGVATVKYGDTALTSASLVALGPLTGLGANETADKYNFSYGYIDNTALATTNILGFGTRTDEYGDVVADYTKSKAWQRGTASSLGINPAGSVTAQS